MIIDKTIDRDYLTKKLASYDFTAKELVLFLDTHPKDRTAMEMYMDIIKKAKELYEAYVSKYGALTANDCVGKDKWCWIDGPWPWEN